MGRVTLRNQSEAPRPLGRGDVGPARVEGANVWYTTDQDGDLVVRAYGREGKPPPFEYDAAIHEKNGGIRYLLWPLLLVAMACGIAWML